jgi:hypothetical protein
MHAPLTPYTLFHVALSLIGILSGLVAVFGFLTARILRAWNLLFLVTTIATSVTGFFFPFHGITPGIILGIVSLIDLAIAVVAYSKRWTRTSWIKTYIVTAFIAEYLNVLVLIVQSFQKITPLHMFAPKGNEPIVAATQLAALVVFIILAVIALRQPAFRTRRP